LIKKSQQEDDDIKYQQEEEDVESQQENDGETQENEPHIDEEDNEEMPLPRSPSKRVQKNHPKSQIIGDKSAGVEKRRRLAFDSEQAMLSLIEPKSIK
jgi:hypothetical protein